MTVTVGDVFIIGGANNPHRPFNNVFYKLRIGRKVTVIAIVGGVVLWNLEGEESDYNPYYGQEYFDSIDLEFFEDFAKDVGLTPCLETTEASWEV